MACISNEVAKHQKVECSGSHGPIKCAGNLGNKRLYSTLLRFGVVL